MKSIVGHIIIGIEDPQLCGGQHVLVPGLKNICNSSPLIISVLPFYTLDRVGRHREFLH